MVPSTTLSIRRLVISFLAVATIWMMGPTHVVTAQRSNRSGASIAAGTTINVRTNEEINTSDSDGRIFTGVIDQDVMDSTGRLAIPRKSSVELLVKQVSDNEVGVDLDAIVVNGQRYGVETEDNIVDSDKKDGVGSNGRTGKYVGGGAILGAILGGIAGGGKGAAIGAGAGAAAGAGTQVLTRGGSVKIPSESLLTFRLQQPLRAGMADNSITRDGHRYRPGYSQTSSRSSANNASSAAYEEGMRAGQSDRERNRARNLQSSRWTRPDDRRDYEAGYNQAYDNRNNNDRNGNANNANSAAYEDGMRAGQSDRDRNRARNLQSSRWSRGNDRRDYEAGYNQAYNNRNNNDRNYNDRNNNNNRDPNNRPGSGYGGNARVTIGNDKNISWQSPDNSQLFVQVDNEPQKSFAAGRSGAQMAPWIEPGHVYLFILKDMRGNEIARDQLDTRGGNRRRPE